MEQRSKVTRGLNAALGAGVGVVLVSLVMAQFAEGDATTSFQEGLWIGGLVVIISAAISILLLRMKGMPPTPKADD